MFAYQTPAQRRTNPEVFVPGELVLTDRGVGIKKPNGAFVSILHDDPFRENEQPAGMLDQETFLPDATNPNMLVADRTGYPGGAAYIILTVSV